MSIPSQQPPLVDFHLIDPEGKETIAEQIGILLEANGHTISTKLVQQLLSQYQEWADEKAKVQGHSQHWLEEARAQQAAMAAEEERQLAKVEQLPANHPSREHMGRVIPFGKGHEK